MATKEQEARQERFELAKAEAEMLNRRYRTMLETAMIALTSRK